MLFTIKISECACSQLHGSCVGACSLVSISSKVWRVSISNLFSSWNCVHESECEQMSESAHVCKKEYSKKYLKIFRVKVKRLEVRYKLHSISKQNIGNVG